ncbi:MAG: serpin family protein [Muribaculaceae bacterium]|nr:serpin family protein [Muribaculaceae bacterium]
MFSLLAIGTVLVFSSCSSNDEPENVKKEIEPIIPDTEMTTYLDGQRQTAWNIMKELSKDNDGKNIAFSPLSFYLTMSIVAEGVNDECAAELAEFLNCDLNSVHQYNKQILSSFPYIDAKTDLKFANSIWVDKKFTLNQKFLDAVKENYFTETNVLDFSSDMSLKTINSWISEKTSGLISDFFESKEDLNDLCLVNSLYFHSPWTNVFDSKHTQRGSFFRTDAGAYQSVEMMSRLGYENYAEVDGSQILVLPFGNENFSISFILPPEGVSLRNFISNYDLQKICKAAKKENVDIYLPKFEVKSNETYGEILRKMNLNLLFEPSVWTKVSDSKSLSLVKNIKQSVSFKIDENGGTAASVTSSSSVLMPQYINFRADRPFFYMITDKTCNIPILMGTVEKF